MGTITLPNFRTTADVKMNTKLKDGGVYIEWSSLTEVKAWIWSDAQKALAGRVDVSVDTGDATVLKCLYASTKPQYPGVNRLIVQGRYNGSLKTYDKPVFNFVPRTAEATGSITISDPEVDVEIEVTDTTSSILDNTIAAALAAAAHAEHAASLVPLQVLQDCEAATAVALTAASKAPVIGENGNWWVWNSQQAAYVDTGNEAQGPTGNGIASWVVEESQEDAGDNVVTVTFTDGTTETFTYKNGHTGNGIASIVQTVESPYDAGTNVITVTMTNGTVITFNVKNGSKGQPGAAQAAYKSVETLPTASAETMDKIYLTPSGTAGVYNMSYTDFDGASYSWVTMGTTAIQLADYATKEEVSQLQQEVDDFIESENIAFGFSEKTGNSSASQDIGMPIPKDGVLESVYLNVSADATVTIFIMYPNHTGTRRTLSKAVTAGENILSLNEPVYKDELIVLRGATTYFVNDSSFEQIFWYVYGSTWAVRTDHIKWSAGYSLQYTSEFDAYKETVATRLAQACQSARLCVLKSAGGQAVQSITKSGTTATLVFSGDTCLYGRTGEDTTQSAFIIAPTSGVTYTIENVSGLFADLVNNTLSVVSVSSISALENALNTPGKVLLAINLWGYLVSPIASLQTEFDKIQYGGADEITITENTPNNYTTRIVKGGVTHEVANGNVSNYFKSGSATFGLFEKTGTASASQVVGMPVSEGGKLASVYLNNAESATINIKIYNADFSAVRKTISKSVTSGENTLTLNEDVAAGENIVLEGAKPYFANDSSFEQIFWYNYGGSTGWALRSDHIKWSAGYTLVSDSVFNTLSNKVSELENKEEDLEDRVYALEQNIEYVTVTVERNLADFNSIRETIDGITDASYYKRYIVKVPAGRWFECDIKGKKYVTIQGVDARKTVLYCDGTSDKVTPDDYSFDTYAGQSLSSINQAYKHIINVRDDIDVRGLTLEVNDCKYCAHIDNTGFKTASFKEIFFKEINANVTFTIGIGSHAGQEILFERCDFKAYDTHTICAYVHNWNNLTAINTVTFKDCQFNKNFFRYDELGSDYSTFLNLLNCYSSAVTPQLVFQTVTTDGHSHWINPETGQPITDMKQLPYCTHIDVCGSNVASIYQDGTRPDIADYIIGKIGN